MVPNEIYAFNGNPLQYSYLGDLVDRGAWQATVHGILQARIPEWVAISFSSRGRWGPNDREPRDWG